MILASILIYGQDATPRSLPNSTYLGEPQTIAKSSQEYAKPQQSYSYRFSPIELIDSIQSNTKADPNKGTTPDSPDKPWSLSDKIAVGACIAGFSQFLALIATIWIMIRNGRRQLRAHVFPDNVAIVDGTFLDPPEPHKADIPAISMIIKNSGQTPAYDVVSWWEIKVIPIAEENSLAIPVLAKKHSTTVGMGSTFNKGLWFDRALTADEKSAIFAGTIGIYGHGRIEYRDVFNVRHFSNFRLVYTGKTFPPVKGAVMSFCEQGNDAN